MNPMRQSEQSKENPVIETWWDLFINDGLSTDHSRQHLPALEIPKSNWVLTIDTPLCATVKVACCIMYLYLWMAASAGMVSMVSERPVEGLFHAGVGYCGRHYPEEMG
ncbi:hypothetical protein BDZ91DRAFT_757309 [Kalaharituber pfeilii]|nr:hypothetical protein BDZ91DRAFT_757309 [Kalaharituber pfeilii]